MGFTDQILCSYHLAVGQDDIAIAYVPLDNSEAIRRYKVSKSLVIEREPSADMEQTYCAAQRTIGTFGIHVNGLEKLIFIS